MIFSLPTSEEEAEERFRDWQNQDPFPTPTIPAALLNSADIIDYVTVTGMIFPFYLAKGNDRKLKPASYEVDLLGVVKYWDETGKEIRKTIGVGDSFVLKRNSIAFAQVEPTFRLPNYIAVRFNLKIQHVYRGILLGTGPLVDPGFKGPLYIPLHNLTDNDYTFRGGEGLIWMEFTKLNWPPPIAGTSESSQTVDVQRVGTFIAFPERKLQRRTLDDYLYYANPHGSIRSSIPVGVEAARAAAERAESQVKRLATLGIIGIVAALIGLGGFVFQAMSFVRLVRTDVVDRLNTLEAQLGELRRKVGQVERGPSSPPQSEAPPGKSPLLGGKGGSREDPKAPAVGGKGR